MKGYLEKLGSDLWDCVSQCVVSTRNYLIDQDKALLELQCNQSCSMLLGDCMHNLNQMLIYQGSSIYREDLAQSFINVEGVIQVLKRILAQNPEEGSRHTFEVYLIIGISVEVLPE